MARTALNELMHQWIYGDPTRGIQPAYTPTDLAHRCGCDPATVLGWTATVQPTWPKLFSLGQCLRESELLQLARTTFPGTRPVIAEPNGDFTGDGVTDHHDLREGTQQGLERVGQLMRLVGLAIATGDHDQQSDEAVGRMCDEIIVIAQRVKDASDGAKASPRRRCKPVTSPAAAEAARPTTTGRRAARTPLNRRSE